MRSDRPKRSAPNRFAATAEFKPALIALATLLFVALPWRFNAHAGAEPKAPSGFLFTVNTTDDHNDFSCDGRDCTLREAIQAANNDCHRQKYRQQFVLVSMNLRRC